MAASSEQSGPELRCCVRHQSGWCLCVAHQCSKCMGDEGVKEMFKFEITELGGAAFADFPEEEIARLLRKVAAELADGALAEPGYMRPLIDINGATVGEWGVTS